MILVGAVWGCTNPFLRRGSVDEPDGKQFHTSSEGETFDNTKGNYGVDQDRGSPIKKNPLVKSLSRLLRVGVWLPYLLNQCGSLLYYKLLATSNLTLSVPICNALALVFSSMTGFLLGERVDKPMRAALGSALVSVGVGICVMSGGGAPASDHQSDGEL